MVCGASVSLLSPRLPQLISVTPARVLSQSVQVELHPLAPTDVGGQIPPETRGRLHPRVVVLLGPAPKARFVRTEVLGPSDIPPRTRKQDVVLAVDADGDGRVDVVGRHACKDGGQKCQEWRCLETWTRQRGVWRRQEQLCGD